MSLLLIGSVNALTHYYLRPEVSAEQNFITKFSRENIMSHVAKDLVDFTASGTKW